MLIGGFYSVDFPLGVTQPEQKSFSLRCASEEAYPTRVYVNNGRTATVYALRSGIPLTNQDVILLPDYLCVSILNALETVPAKFRYYRVRKDLSIDLDDLQKKMDKHVKVIYLIHYFGIPHDEQTQKVVLQLSKAYGAQIIEDLTQTLYTVCPGRIGFGDYLVASTRKWLPGTDGGLMAARKGLPLKPQALNSAYDEAVYRQLLISIARQYYDTHPQADITPYLLLEKQANAARYLDFTPREMTEFSRNILFCYDHEASMAARRRNYQVLYDALQNIPGVTLLAKPLDHEGGFVPFGFPILVDNRDRVYTYLANHGIIGEIQWILPTQYYTPGADAQYLSDHNIMLQCDQRYGSSEMEQVADCLKQYFIRGNSL